jgi:hypothetical protein
MVFETVDKEKSIAELAITEPSAQNPTAMPTLGFATPSLMCGAQAIVIIAATETML